MYGTTEVFGPDDGFAAPGGFRIVTKGLIWLFKGKRLPTPGLEVGTGNKSSNRKAEGGGRNRRSEDSPLGVGLFFEKLTLLYTMVVRC